MQVKLLKGRDSRKWDNFILSNSQSSFFMLSGWKRVVQSSYNFRPLYLIAEEDEEIKGVLPFFKIESFTGKKLVSVPFATEGGVVAVDDTVKNTLLSAARGYILRKKYNYFELRQKHLFDSNMKVNSSYCHVLLDLRKDQESLFESFRRDVKRKIKKAEESGFEIDKGHEYLKDFYRVFSYNMKRLGTPVDSLRFFKKIVEEFPDRCNIYVAKKDDKVISAVFMFYFKKTAKSEWASSYKEYDKLGVNRLLYWHAIQDAMEDGYEFFDFGRSLFNEGTYDFKIAWGADPVKLNYQYFINKGSVMDTAKTNPKRKLFAFLWSRLPLFVANRLGPFVRRMFP